MRIAKVFAIVLCLSIALPPHRASGAETFFRHSCPQTLVVQGGVRCGTVVVFENRSAQNGRTIDLNVIIVGASSKPVAKDAIFGIAGGPGQPTADQNGLAFATLAGDAHLTRDVVLVDQRGTGGSHPLQCDVYPGTDATRYFGPDWPVEVFTECAQRLGAIADLSQYATDAAADDLDDVRAALGYDSVDLIGASYGTTVALDYLRRHPQHVRTAVLDGVVAPDSKGPLLFARAAQSAIDGLFSACAADPACHSAYPDPRADLTAALARLARGPVSATVTNPATNASFSVQIDVETWVSTVDYALYDASTSGALLKMIHSAASGDFSASADMTAAVRANLATGVFWGMAMSVVCPEEVNNIDPAEIPQEVQGSFLGDYRLRAEIAACAVWPHSSVDPAFFHPVRSNAPVLLLTGGLDPATPVAEASRVERYLPHALNVVFPQSTHGGETPCGSKLVAAFISAGGTGGLDTSCAAQEQRPPIVL